VFKIGAITEHLTKPIVKVVDRFVVAVPVEVKVVTTHVIAAGIWDVGQDGAGLGDVTGHILEISEHELAAQVAPCEVVVGLRRLYGIVPNVRTDGEDVLCETTA